MTRRIFNVGMGRTGTRSLAAAMERLGFRTATVTPDELQLDWRIKTLQGRADFEFIGDAEYISGDLLAHLRPVAELYPDCQAILTIRDEGAWLESVRQHWTKGDREETVMGVLGSTDEIHLCNRHLMRVVKYGIGCYCESVLRDAFRQRNRLARELFNGRLLELDICGGDGYEELCDWLGVDRPDEPFPWIRR